ncbi:hypothetical protein ABT288_07200 [Streptomyces sp. NPDC001093]
MRTGRPSSSMVPAARRASSVRRLAHADPAHPWQLEEPARAAYRESVVS